MMSDQQHVCQVLQFIADRPLDRRIMLLSDPRALHRLLFATGLALRAGQPGQYRKPTDARGGQVCVMSPTRDRPWRFEGLAADQVGPRMRRFRDQMRALLTLPPPVAAVPDTLTHVMADLVRVHPFADGNGRTARLLVAACAQHMGRPMAADWTITPRPHGPGFGFLLMAYPQAPAPLIAYMRRFFSPEPAA